MSVLPVAEVMEELMETDGVAPAADRKLMTLAQSSGTTGHAAAADDVGSQPPNGATLLCPSLQPFTTTPPVNTPAPLGALPECTAAGGQAGIVICLAPPVEPDDNIAAGLADLGRAAG